MLCTKLADKSVFPGYHTDCPMSVGNRSTVVANYSCVFSSASPKECYEVVFLKKSKSISAGGVKCSPSGAVECFSPEKLVRPYEMNHFSQRKLETPLGVSKVSNQNLTLNQNLSPKTLNRTERKFRRWFILYCRAEKQSATLFAFVHTRKKNYRTENTHIVKNFIVVLPESYYSTRTANYLSMKKCSTRF